VDFVTISEDTNPVAATLHCATGGKFIFHNNEEDDFHDVLDNEGNVIGQGYRGPYVSGFAVHTKAFAGFVDEAQIVYVD
jgi:hypothetical protein